MWFSQLLLTRHRANPLSLFARAVDATNKSQAHAPALAELGVEDIADLADVTDSDLISIGFNKIQDKRLRRQVPERAPKAGQSRPASPQRGGCTCKFTSSPPTTFGGIGSERLPAGTAPAAAGLSRPASPARGGGAE